ncbi:NADH dehydrogenase (ubiquinone) 1 alpha subcomplex [Musa troglodytarum]|uniref:NADH dehydrogenase (Ubiquinone) 1 alpha subcomplex n=1 Tax=Musa troglodytarum TaxID=320322 RepID=A0A9E7JG93_9LILI|nr:NADH dehydrogenase (ubiquinone) 1 alpha subcomplex [Musa troglodytarum]
MGRPACLAIKNESWPLDRHLATHLPASVLEFELFLFTSSVRSSAVVWGRGRRSAAARITTMFLRRVMLRGGMGAAWMQEAGKVKETTGIVGLDVVPNAREVLVSLYNRTLKEIQAVPQDEGYRKAIESFTRHRLQVCQEEEDWEVIEKRIGCGQVEELIEEAQDELKLIAKMIAMGLTSAELVMLLLEEKEWDPWGVPEDYECEVIEDDTPIPKHVPQHRPCLLPEEFFKTIEALSTKSVPEGEPAPQLKA